jgi:homoserine/homoserine lactone efflux protein
MELHVYLAFVIATTIMIVLPGPSVLLTVAHSISFGWQHALSTVAGATMGIAVQLIIAAIGLTSLLNVVAEAFEWLRWAGAAYLVYLGIKQWQSAGIPLEVDTSSVSKTNLFVQGLVVTIPNPQELDLHCSVCAPIYRCSASSEITIYFYCADISGDHF